MVFLKRKTGIVYFLFLLTHSLYADEAPSSVYISNTSEISGPLRELRTAIEHLNVKTETHIGAVTVSTAQTAQFTTVVQNLNESLIKLEQAKIELEREKLAMAQQELATRMSLMRSQPSDMVEQPSWWQRIKSVVRGGQSYESVSSVESSSIRTYMATHKKELLIRALAAAYIIVNYRLFVLNNYLQSSERWLAWHAEVSLAQFMQIPHADLCNELMSVARLRYAESPGVTQLDKEILKKLLKELDAEISACASYQWLVDGIMKLDMLEKQVLEFCGSYIPSYFGIFNSFCMSFIASRLAIASIFYLNKKLTVELPEKKARVMYLKSVLKELIKE